MLTEVRKEASTVSDDSTEAQEVAKLFDLWKASRTKGRAKRFRPVGLISSGRFIFLRLERKKCGATVPKLVAKAELVIGTLRDPANRSAVNLARSVAYEKLCT